ncbi:MAG TPA: hypothetical protein VF002_05695 [Gaiellaceae bacterium]
MSAAEVDRTSRQGQVETLLRELDERRRDLHRLKANGAASAGLLDQKREFLEVGQHLRNLVGPGPATQLTSES